MLITTKKLIVKTSFEVERSATIDFMIDNGAVYSLVPRKILDELGIKPYRTLDFSLVDGSIIKRRIGDAYFELNGTGGASPVIYGEEGDDALSGATILEALGLVLNPFTRELYPMQMFIGRALRAG